MTVKAQIINMVDLVPEEELPILLEVVKRFASDDIATPEDIAAHIAALKEFAAGETIPHNAIDWN